MSRQIAKNSFLDVSQNGAIFDTLLILCCCCCYVFRAIHVYINNIKCILYLYLFFMKSAIRDICIQKAIFICLS